MPREKVSSKYEGNRAFRTYEQPGEFWRSEGRSSTHRFVLLAMMEITFAAQCAEPLEAVARQALKDGKDGSINAGFATMLGLTTNQAVPVKHLTADRNGVTNRFTISLADKKTIVLGTRSNQLTTFYLTDLSGKLKRAIVNDGSIKAGGLTNISLRIAEPKFQQEKEWWIRKHAR